MEVANAKLQCLSSMSYWSLLSLLFVGVKNQSLSLFLKHPFLFVLSLLFWSNISWLRFLPWRVFFFFFHLLVSTKIFISILNLFQPTHSLGNSIQSLSYNMLVFKDACFVFAFLWSCASIHNIPSAWDILLHSSFTYL